MSTAQDLLNELHQAGCTDKELADSLEVSREYISRLRNGWKQASDQLERAIQSIYDQARQLSEHAASGSDHNEDESEEDQESEYACEYGLGGFSFKFWCVVIGGLILLYLLVTWVRNRQANPIVNTQR